MGTNISTLLSEEFGDELPEQMPNLLELLDGAATANSDRIAIVARHQPSDLYAYVHDDDEKMSNRPHLRWTYRSLQRAAYSLARSLQFHGVRKGMTISTVVQNGIEWVLIVYASVLLGCPVAPLSARTLISKEEATHMLKTADARVILAGDAKIASSIDQLIDDSGLNITIKLLVDADKTHQGWHNFATLLDSNSTSLPRDFSYTPPKHDDNDLCIIAFTSGTTSLPKGCPSSNKAIQSTICALKKITQMDGGSISCLVLPNNHMIGFLTIFSYCSVGGSLVFPGAGFESSAVLSALEEDQCTNFICVPTMLLALLDRIAGKKHKFNLRQMDVAGAALAPQHLRQCIYSMGSRAVGTSFGMTEGVPVISGGRTNPEDLIRRDTVICGRPLPGARIRICDPETRRVVKRGEYGELHQGGNQLIQHYLGLDASKDFYVDENGRRWFCTGDQAVMLEDGSISIVGRYKDMLIRGGENISPAVIERVLNQLDGIDAQVVGCKDEIAGEIPVAVYQAKGIVSINTMQDRILDQLGPIYMPTEFLTFDDLGIEEFPKTISGKIKKTQLASLVHDYMQKQQPVMVNGYHDSMQDRVLRIWSSILGIPADRLNLQSSVSDFADSITIMRFRDKIRKETGKNITLDDMASNDSIAAQIHLLENQPDLQRDDRPAFALERAGPPKADDVIHTSGEEALMDRTRALVEQAIKPRGFTWDDDVEDLIPAYDYINVQFTQQRSISHNRRHALITNSHDTKTLEVALRAALSKHSILRSFLIRQDVGSTSEEAFYVTMRPNDRWFEQAITQHGELHSIAALQQFTSEDTTLDHSFSDPLCRGFIFHVKETNSAGLAYNGNHATFDAISISLFYEDIDKALVSQSPALDPHIPYKFWADTFYSLRDSSAARRAVNWHVQRLSSLTSHRKAFFPAQRAPRWFLGPNRDWKPAETDLKKGYTNLHRACISEPSSYETGGITWRGELPSLKKLRDAIPQLTNPTIAKAALAIMNVSYTNHTHAVFACIEAGRGFLPFVPNHLATQLDHINCADVAGPTFEFVADVIAVDKSEPLSAFLTRLQADQARITLNAHAPVRSIVAALGTSAEGAAAGDLLLDVFRRQLFNWAPGAGNTGRSSLENIRQVLGNSQSDNGLVFNAGVGGEAGTTCTLSTRWDDANTTREEAEGMMRRLSGILMWITEGGDWDRPVGDFVGCL